MGSPASRTYVSVAGNEQPPVLAIPVHLHTRDDRTPSKRPDTGRFPTREWRRFHCVFIFMFASFLDLETQDPTLYTDTRCPCRDLFKAGSVVGMGVNYQTRPRSGCQSTWKMDPPHEACASPPTVSICLCLPFPCPVCPLCTVSIRVAKLGWIRLHQRHPATSSSDAFETAFLMAEQLSSANQNDQGGCHILARCRLLVIHRWGREIKKGDRQSFANSETT